MSDPFELFLAKRIGDRDKFNRNRGDDGFIRFSKNAQTISDGLEKLMMMAGE